MCGRYFRHTPREELAAAFRAELGSELGAAYNVAPGQQVLAVRFNTKTGERRLDELRWGLVPSFAKDAKVFWKTINARAETVDTAASYRSAFVKRRCLIVADGFFEWKAERQRKQPYAIALQSGKPFALAGLWEAWQEPNTGEWLRTCTIVTTEANAAVGQIHDRMPVILEENDYARWLGEVPAEPGELKALLRPYAGELAMWPVSARMNKADVEGPEVIERVELEAEAEDAAFRPRRGKKQAGPI